MFRRGFAERSIEFRLRHKNRIDHFEWMADKILDWVNLSVNL